jgi:SAM-dependent methyltransferase
MIYDIACKPMESLRVLDLGCLEGLYALELASHGAEVLGIEGREANVEKARFAKEACGLDNLEFVKDDVRNLGKRKYGEFDVVLCLGILYHLDTPDVFAFLEAMADVCRGFLIIDTHISLAPHKSCIYKDKEYWGSIYREHDMSSSSDEVAQALWASLNNLNSFWLTRSSLYNALADVGFTSVYECHNPPRLREHLDRITLVAMKGQHRGLISSPEKPDERWPEKGRLFTMVTKMALRAREILPKALKQTIKKLR